MIEQFNDSMETCRIIVSAAEWELINKYRLDEAHQIEVALNDMLKAFECLAATNEREEFEKRIRADERKKIFDEVEEAMYHQCFECDNDEDMQKWDGGNWFRYKLFENVLNQLRRGEE